MKRTVSIMASKRRLRRKNCLNKIDYATLAGAIKASHRMRDKYSQAFDAYKCSCGYYHIGHRTQSTRAKLRHQFA